MGTVGRGPMARTATNVSLGGGKRDRTADLYNAIVALSQLSYTPRELRILAEIFLPAGKPINLSRATISWRKASQTAGVQCSRLTITQAQRPSPRSSSARLWGVRMARANRNSSSLGHASLDTAERAASIRSRCVRSSLKRPSASSGDSPTEETLRCRAATLTATSMSTAPVRAAPACSAAQADTASTPLRTRSRIL